MKFLKEVLAWLKYILPFAIIMFFKKSKASELAYTHFLDPAESAKLDVFIANAKRPDWDEDDCLSARMFATELLNNRNIVDLYNLPEHYFCLVSDELLLNSIAAVNLISKKLANEQARRGV